MPPLAPVPSSTERAVSPPERDVSCTNDERLEELRLDLRRRIEELVTTGGARLETLKREFDAAWTEFTAGIERKYH